MSKRIKHYFLSLLSAAIILIWAPADTVALSGCLTVGGTVSSANQTARIGESFELSYEITPSGSIIGTIDREPIDLVLVLDRSLSMSYGMNTHKGKPTRMEALKEASQALISELRHADLGDRTALISFNDRAQVDLNFTDKYSSVEQKIKGLSPSGYTNLGHGLHLAHQLFDASPKNRKKIVIALTDGQNSHYTEVNHRGQESIKEGKAQARRYAKEKANVLIADGIPIYTIALGSKGDTEVDHELLEEISIQSGARKFEAGDAKKLAEIFQNITQEITLTGQLTNLLIKQPLPGSGFEITGGTAEGASINGQYLIIPLPAIPFPYEDDSDQLIKVLLKQTAAVGEYEFDDGLLSYTNACGVMDSTPITNDVKLTITGWIDVWGNLYTADASGNVTRYKHGDLSKPQWTIQEHQAPVVNITFDDSAANTDDDVIVKVTYNDGQTRAWDLRPSAPTIILKDSNGQVPAVTGWLEGNVMLAVSGAVNQLPESTIYHNEDFVPAHEGGTYIRSYEIRMNDGSWTALANVQDNPLAGLSGQVMIEAQALTEAISGRPSIQIPGQIARTNLHLDNEKPGMILSIAHSVVPSDVNPTFTVTASDADSGIQSIALTIDGITRVKTFPGHQRTVSHSWKLEEWYSDKALRQGWKKLTLKAVDQTGLEQTLFRIGSEDELKAEHYELVYPGLQGSLQSIADYSMHASATPVTVHVRDVVETIIPDRLNECTYCEAVTITRMEVKAQVTAWDGAVKTTIWTKLGAMTFKVTADGSTKLYLRLTDSLGHVYDTEAMNTPLIIKINYAQQRY